MRNYLQNSRNYLLISLLFYLLAIASQVFFNPKDSLDHITRQVQSAIAVKEKQTDLLFQEPLIDSVLKYVESPRNNTSVWRDLVSRAKQENLSLVVYQKKKLVFWTSSRVIPDRSFESLPEGTSFQKLDNGWYIAKKKTFDKTAILSLLNVKREYSYQNEYLRNGFNVSLGFPDYIALADSSSGISRVIHDLDGHNLFSITIDNEKLKASPQLYNIALWLLAFIFSYLCVNSFAKHLWNKGEWLAGLLSIVMVTLLFRLITMYWSVPASIYRLPVFSPEFYASNFLFPSLGDLLINLLLIHWVVYFFYDKVKEIDFRIYSVRKSYIVTFLFICSTFLFIDLINFLLEGLVINSNISFELTNILSLNIYSFVGFFILGLIIYTFFLYTDILISIFHQFFLSKKEKLNVFLFSILAVVAVKMTFDQVNILLITNTFFLIVLERAKTRKKEYLTFPTVILILTVFAIAAAFRLNDFNFEKEKQNRQLLASKLESANDPIAEYLLDGLVKKIRVDTEIKAHFKTKAPKNELIYNRIQQLYFGGYFSKYDLRLYEFGTDGKPFTKNVTRDLSFFNELIDQQCTPTMNSYFYYLSNTFGILTYYGKIPITNEDGTLGTLIIELKSKYFRDDNVFPELLLEGSLKMNKDFQFYSYSIYKQGRLVSQQGDYPYSLQSVEFNEAKGGFTFLINNGYDHLVYKPNQQIMIVVSKIEDSPFKILAVFSYMFGIFAFLLFVFYLRRLLSKSYNLFTVNFRNIKGRIRLLFKTRIQLSMVFSVIFSVSIIGYITFLYISDQYNKQQNERLSQKVRSILLSLEKRTSGLNSFSVRSDDFAIELKNLSDLYLTDINIFDLNGDLIISSQPKIFEEGLISKKMNPDAFIELKRFARSEYSTNEKIGTLSYLSAYAPVRNLNNKAIAYLNLPYFANKSEYETRVSQFLTTFINVYVFIFVVIGFVAFFLANSITFPLTLIEEQLRETKIGKKMDPITWKSRDEIGTLINEYNRMIRELEENTEKLAKSERENAWREMAKQVAHEIKNPLTPMKLGIQHLQRAWEDNDPAIREKFERFSKTMIEQIESLSLIASEFSNFAQMPLAKNEQVDVKEILKNVVNLYKNQGDAEITLGYIPSLRAIVYADKDQMIRTFNNLIKNAIQAIPSTRQGRIDIEILNERDTVLVIIQDNGIGIEDELKEKIFQPNFTTKNSGMGMGLAIIYNIILNIGGKIWFNSSLNKGTTFFVSLPLHEEE